jgi:hypothetical protein
MISRALKNQSGQLLIIGVLLFFIILAVVPALVFMNRTGVHHSIFSQKKSKGRLIAEEGVALAIQQLSKPNAWPYLAGGAMPAAETLPSSQGERYRLIYTSAPSNGLQSYQVGIRTIPMDSAGSTIPGSSVLTTVSQLTTGVKMPTGQTAPAALDLMKVPVVVDNTALLRVEFGPIVVRDTNTWTLSTFLNTSKRPRKFSAGAIAPRVTNPDSETTSDQKEYWAYVSPGFAPLVDLADYSGRAQTTNCPAPASCLLGQGAGAAAADCNPITAGRCDFLNVKTSTIVFNGNWPTTHPDGVIYVNGNAQFNAATVDVSSGGAVIVTGNLILGNNGQPLATVASKSVYLPPGLGAEDPNCTCSDPGCIGTVFRHLDFMGFLYVRGNVLTGVGSNGNWTILGTSRIDGTLTINPSTSFELFYNDMINHQIRTTNFELKVDSMTAVP